jgi:hypothetical protein
MQQYINSSNSRYGFVMLYDMRFTLGFSITPPRTLPAYISQRLSPSIASSSLSWNKSADRPQLNYRSSEEAQPGDVLVFDAGGETHASVTDAMTTTRFLGGAAIGVDGCMRDTPGNSSRYREQGCGKSNGGRPAGRISANRTFTGRVHLWRLSHAEQKN